MRNFKRGLSVARIAPLINKCSICCISNQIIKMGKCSYCYKRSSAERSSHTFPRKDPDILKKWLQNMAASPDWMPTATSRLCSAHFTSDCFESCPGSLKRKLKKGSIPTIFPDSTRRCAYCKTPTSRQKNGRAFHKFPISCPNLLEKWLDNMGVQDWHPTEESVLCSDHFDQSCHKVYNGYLSLRDGSVPTLFTSEFILGIESDIHNK